MATYQLTVTRYVKNDAYKPPEQNDFGYSKDKRLPHEIDEFVETALSVSISEEQFEIIKKATLENWK